MTLESPIKFEIVISLNRVDQPELIKPSLPYSVEFEQELLRRLTLSLKADFNEDQLKDIAQGNGIVIEANFQYAIRDGRLILDERKNPVLIRAL